MEKSKLKTGFPQLQKQRHVFLKINYPKQENEVIGNYIKSTSEKQTYSLKCKISTSTNKLYLILLFYQFSPS